MITKNIALILLFFISGNVVAVQGYVTITEPWIRSAPPNAPMLGAFMNLKNNSDKEIKLVKVHAEGFKRIEMHRTINSEGMMMMVKQEYIPIPAHELVELKPGSWHIMMINPDSVPIEGSSVMINLLFDDGSTQMVHAAVKSSKMMMHNHDTMQMNKQ
jgi:hypothetical protein